jgi:hypothetical protein
LIVNACRSGLTRLPAAPQFRSRCARSGLGDARPGYADRRPPGPVVEVHLPCRARSAVAPFDPSRTCKSLPERGDRLGNPDTDALSPARIQPRLCGTSLRSPRFQPHRSSPQLIDALGRTSPERRYGISRNCMAAARRFCREDRDTQCDPNVIRNVIRSVGCCAATHFRSMKIRGAAILRRLARLSRRGRQAHVGAPEGHSQRQYWGKTRRRVARCFDLERSRIRDQVSY